MLEQHPRAAAVALALTSPGVTLDLLPHGWGLLEMQINWVRAQRVPSVPFVPGSVSPGAPSSRWDGEWEDANGHGGFAASCTPGLVQNKGRIQTFIKS